MLSVVLLPGVLHAVVYPSPLDSDVTSRICLFSEGVILSLFSLCSGTVFFRVVLDLHLIHFRFSETVISGLIPTCILFAFGFNCIVIRLYMPC